MRKMPGLLACLVLLASLSCTAPQTAMRGFVGLAASLPQAGLSSSPSSLSDEDNYIVKSASIVRNYNGKPINSKLSLYSFANINHVTDDTLGRIQDGNVPTQAGLKHKTAPARAP